jgi:hypothetical protein
MTVPAFVGRPSAFAAPMVAHGRRHWRRPTSLTVDLKVDGYESPVAGCR